LMRPKRKRVESNGAILYGDRIGTRCPVGVRRQRRGPVPCSGRGTRKGRGVVRKGSSAAQAGGREVCRRAEARCEEAGQAQRRVP